MIRTFCDYCGKEIKDENSQVVADINVYGRYGVAPKKLNFHFDCAKIIGMAISRVCMEFREKGESAGEKEG